MQTYDGCLVRDYGPDTCDGCQEHHEHNYGIGPETEGDVLGLCTKCFTEYDTKNKKEDERFEELLAQNFG